MKKEKTFEELSKLERGTILEDYFDEGVRILIMRGGGSLCCYLGVPIERPLAGFSYEDFPLNCHYGLTFGDKGEKEGQYPEGYYWYGWDYAHYRDKSFYDLRPEMQAIDKKFGGLKEKDIGWTVEMVKKDAWDAIYEFKKLMKLAEQIKK